jgi:hypothetical protein
MRKVPGVNTHIFKQPDIPWGGLGFPATLSPKLWLDATDLNYLTLSGTDVITLGDKSGNGCDFTQATPANRPVIDSVTNPTKVIFTAANSEFLDGSSGVTNYTSDDDGELIVVAKILTDSPLQRIVCFGKESVVDNNRMHMNYSGSTSDQITIFNNGGSSTGRESDPYNVTKSYGYTKDFIYESGVSIGSNTRASWLNVNTGIDAFHIGRLPASAFYSSEVMEVLYFTNQLTQQKRTDLHTYLANKHSL